MSKFKNYITEQKEEDNKDIQEKIAEFFANNPNPPDEEIHAMAKRMGLQPDDLETHIYALLGSLLGDGNAKKKGFTEKDADSKQLEMGTKVEMEHTTNKILAKRIALDHLAEIPDYYTRLKKMEAEGEKENE
jgi:Protein of unknown function (DUF5661)